MKNDIEKWLKEDGERFLRDIGIRKDQVVLDFGCGVGHYTIPAAKVVDKEGKVYAIDEDEKALSELMKIAVFEGVKNIAIAKASGELKIPIENESIDAILLYDVLHYIEERRKIIDEVHRVMKTNGLLSIYPKHHKLDPVLIGAITTRALCWGSLAIITYLFGKSHPSGIILALFFLLTLFAFMGGIAVVPFQDIWGKAIPSTLRGRFFGYRQLLGGILAIGVGFIVKSILGNKGISFPNNYALLFLLAFLFISISYLALGSVREPIEEVHKNQLNFKDFLKKASGILKSDHNYRKFLGVQILGGAISLALPFYVLYAKDVLSVKLGMVGIFLSAQALGSVLSNVLWAHLSDYIGNKRVIQISIFLGLIAPLIALLIPTYRPELFILVFVLLGFSIMGQVIGNTNFLLDIAPSKDRPAYVSVRGTLRAPVVVFPLIGGVIVQHISYNFLFIITVLTVCAGFILSFQLEEPRKA